MDADFRSELERLRDQGHHGFWFWNTGNSCDALTVANRLSPSTRQFGAIFEQLPEDPWLAACEASRKSYEIGDPSILFWACVEMPLAKELAELVRPGRCRAEFQDTVVGRHPKFVVVIDCSYSPDHYAKQQTERKWAAGMTASEIEDGLLHAAKSFVQVSRDGEDWKITHVPKETP